MTAEASDADRTGGTGWMLLLYSAALVGVASAHLAWLLWRYIPSQVAMFQGFGLELPPSVALLSAASQWWLRLFPLLATFVFLPLAAMVVLGVLYGSLKRRRGIVNGIAIALLAVGLVQVGGNVLVVHAVHRVFERMSTDETFQRSLRDFDAYRRQQRPGADP